MAKKPTAKLWSVKQGKLANFTLEADQNHEILATCGDEVLKFAATTKEELQKMFKAHNNANKGTVARPQKELDAEEERRKVTQELIDSLG